MTPENVTRLAQIAMAIEPIPNKVGLTTRYTDIVDTLKLEYFIVSAINSGNRILELMSRKKFTPSYDLLTQCVIENHLNRDGLRVNSGQVLLIWPILITLRDYECNNIEDLTINMVKHLKDSCMLDVCNFQLSNHFPQALWEHHKKHWKLIDIKSKTLWEHLHTIDNIDNYFETEIRECFPTIVKLYKDLNQEEIYSNEMERLFLKFKTDNIPDGQLADLMAISIFLAMYFDDYEIR